MKKKIFFATFNVAGETAKFMCATEMKWTGITATWMKDNKPLGDAMGK